MVNTFLAFPSPAIGRTAHKEEKTAVKGARTPGKKASSAFGCLRSNGARLTLAGVPPRRDWRAREGRQSVYHVSEPGQCRPPRRCQGALGSRLTVPGSWLVVRGSWKEMLIFPLFTVHGAFLQKKKGRFGCTVKGVSVAV